MVFKLLIIKGKRKDVGGLSFDRQYARSLVFLH